MNDPNFGQLLSDDLYVRYFLQLERAIQLLQRSYGSMYSNADRDVRMSYEIVLIQRYLQKLHKSIQAMRMRYTYRHAIQSKLHIDMTDSGFPNHDDVMSMQVDAERAQEVLRKLPSRVILKKQLVDALIQEKVDQPELLADLTDHSYYNMLESSDEYFFLQVPGDLRSLGAANGRQSFVYSWGFYDVSENIPYVNFLYFECDTDSVMLELDDALRAQIQDVVKTYGMRAGNLMVAAVGIDTDVDRIYPKMLKRVSIGPLYSQLVFEGREGDVLSDRESILLALLQQSGARDDFILFSNEEQLWSIREEEAANKSLLQSLGFRKGRKQIYEVGHGELVQLRGVTSRRTSVMLPHSVLQHVSDDAVGLVPELGSGTIKLPYGEKGELHVAH